MGASAQAGPADRLDHILLKVHFPLRNQNHRSPAGDAHGIGQIAGPVPHDLHHGAAFVGLHGVPQAVDALQGDVAGGIVPDGVGGAGDVVVDGARNPDHGDPVVRQTQQALKGAVAADAHQGVHPQKLAGSQGLVPPRLLNKLQTAGGVEHGSAPPGDIADALKVQPGEIAVQQAVVAPADADTLNAIVQGRPHHGADGGVHAGSVSSAGKHSDSTDSSFHK